MNWYQTLSEVDPTVADLISRETARQENGLELIASENFVSPAVLEALGTPLTNKYARFGASPRGTQALVLGGKMQALLNDRVHVACEDIRSAVFPALRHRILLNFEGEAEHVDTDDILKEIVRDVPESVD